MNQKKIISILFILLFAVLFSTDVFASSAVEETKGSLVIVGGALGSTNEAVYRKFIELAGGKENAKIGIIPAASSGLKSSKAFRDDLIKYGIAEENVDIIPIAVKDDKKTLDVDESKWIDNANNPEVANKIRSYNGIWFVGGNQTRITKALLKEDGTNTLALNTIWDVYKNGGVIGGTSAGATVMSDPMIAGGNSLGALNYGFTDKYVDENDQLNGPVYLEKGLGFFPYGIIDQHFDTRARLERLITAAYQYRDRFPLAYGIDENTALLFVNSTKTIEVVGKGGVTIVDMSKASKDERFKQAAIKDIYISYIVAGDQFNIIDETFTIDSSKDLTNGYEYYDVKAPILNTGILSGYPMLKDFIMYNLVDNTGTNSVKSFCFDEKGRGVELVFRKTADTKGYWGYKDGNIDSYSAVNVALDINPIIVTIKPALTEYTVKKGDVLWRVAKELGVALDEIIKINNLKNPNLLLPGQKLIVPQD